MNFSTTGSGTAGKLVPTRKAAPCKVCGDTAGRCRSKQGDPDYALCMDRRDSQPGWGYIGETRDGTWGQFKRADVRTSSGRQTTKTKARPKAETPTPAANTALPLDKRSHHLERLLTSGDIEVRLQPADLTDLRGRGLSNSDILNNGYTSVERGQIVDFPGLADGAIPNLKDAAIKIWFNGYLCPIRNVDGQITGFQIRDRDAKGSSKYKWLSKDGSAHLPGTEENPLSHFGDRQNFENAPRIALVEGTGAKPHLTHLRLGLPTIGASGGHFTTAELAEVLGLNPAAEIVLYPDSGWQVNEQVARKYEKLSEFCQQHGRSLLIADWGHWEVNAKGDRLLGDIDEIDVAAVEIGIKKPFPSNTSEPEDSSDSAIPKPRLEIEAGSIHDAAETVLHDFAAETDPRSRIYVQGNSNGYTLVRVLRPVGGIASRYLSIADGNEVLEPLTAESLQCEINRRFQILKVSAGKNGELQYRRIDCPAALARHLMAMGRWPQLPILRGLSYTPLLTKTGEVISQPGYHEGTGYLLQFDPSHFKIAANPTRNDVEAALALLLDLLGEFCFKTEVDRSAALALLLTSISRKLYGLAPLFAVNAHQPGTGKGALVALASILATGNTAAGVAGFTDDDAEMAKRVLSTLLSGTPIVNVDNVDRRLGGGTLERVLTAEFYTDRILGASKNATVGTQVTWTANGNNLSFTTDMARRTILIELDAGVELPEARTFSREIEKYALENRGALVSAAITVMQAYLLSGSPIPQEADGNPINPPKLGSFGDWDSVVRRSLLWLGQPDPVLSQATIRDSDDNRLALAGLLESWHEAVGSIPLTAQALIQRAIATSGDLKNTLLEVCLDPRQGQPSPKLLGYFLRRSNGVVVNGYRLTRRPKTKSGVEWSVEAVTITKPSSPPSNAITVTVSRFGGDDGDDTPNRSGNLAQVKQVDDSPTQDSGVVTLVKVSSPPSNTIAATVSRFSGDDGDDTPNRSGSEYEEW
jgi:hypothetical protein